MDKFNVTLKMEGLQTNAADLSSTTDTLNQTWTQKFTEGTAVNKIDRFYSDSFSIAANTASNIDLAGSLTHVFGATVAAARLKFLAIRHKTASADDVSQIGGHATAALLLMGSVEGLDTDQPYWFLRQGGMFMVTAPDATAYVVNAGTEDILRIYNDASASVDYDLVIGYSLT